MTYIPRAHRSPPRIEAAEIWTPADESELEALVATCALVACADGIVSGDERQRMIERMHLVPAVALFGVQEVIQGVDALSERFDRHPQAGAAEAEAAIRRVAGRGSLSRALLEAGQAVAAADGCFDGDERHVIQRICELLDLEPEALAATSEARRI